jgi:hypothetical protein
MEGYAVLLAQEVMEPSSLTPMGTWTSQPASHATVTAKSALKVEVTNASHVRLRINMFRGRALLFLMAAVWTKKSTGRFR